MQRLARAYMRDANTTPCRWLTDIQRANQILDEIGRGACQLKVRKSIRDEARPPASHIGSTPEFPFPAVPAHHASFLANRLASAARGQERMRHHTILKANHPLSDQVLPHNIAIDQLVIIRQMRRNPFSGTVTVQTQEQIKIMAGLVE